LSAVVTQVCTSGPVMGGGSVLGATALEPQPASKAARATLDTRRRMEVCEAMVMNLPW
jgi:hypothetical protein